MFGRWMHAREIAHMKRDDNRVMRPFAWGVEFIREHVNGDDPRTIFREHTVRAMSDSDGVGINVNAVNDPPVNSVPVATQSISEDNSLTFSSAGGNAITMRTALLG